MITFILSLLIVWNPGTCEELHKFRIPIARQSYIPVTYPESRLLITKVPSPGFLLPEVDSTAAVLGSLPRGERRDILQGAEQGRSLLMA